MRQQRASSQTSSWERAARPDHSAASSSFAARLFDVDLHGEGEAVVPARRASQHLLFDEPQYPDGDDASMGFSRDVRASIPDGRLPDSSIPAPAAPSLFPPRVGSCYPSPVSKEAGGDSEPGGGSLDQLVDHQYGSFLVQDANGIANGGARRDARTQTYPPAKTLPLRLRSPPRHRVARLKTGRAALLLCRGGGKWRSVAPSIIT